MDVSDASCRGCGSATLPTADPRARPNRAYTRRCSDLNGEVRALHPIAARQCLQAHPRPGRERRDVTAEPVATCFISYSHADKPYATAIATGLEECGYRVWIDEGELRIGDSLVEAISAAIGQVDFLLALVSEASVTSNWCQKEVALAMTGEIDRQGITVLPCRIGDTPMPPALADKLYLSLDPARTELAIEALDRDMRQHLAPAQPLPPRRRKPQHPIPANPVPDERRASWHQYVPTVPVRMTGVDTNSMTSPRNDGTRGSALYMVPITLDVAPDDLWARLFVQHWNRPSSWSSMHRPGIASVAGATIRLDGTTVEEVERTHAGTLKLAVEAANRDRAALAESEDQERAEVQARQAAHLRAAEEAAARIKFE